MFANEIIIKMPCWYILLAVLFSLYYAIRGVVEQKVINIIVTISATEKTIIFYIQDFLFKFIITMSSFVALFAANYIFPSKTEINSISIGHIILLIFLFVWGIIGACGYLTLFISRGKIPRIKG